MTTPALDWVTPSDAELALLRRDPLLVEQELDVRPALAEALENALGTRAGTRFWCSRHGHLLSLTLLDAGRGRPSRAEVAGWWERYEPRPPDADIDVDLLDFCSWVAAVAPGIEPQDVARVAARAGLPRRPGEGELLRTPEARFLDLPDFPYAAKLVEVEGLRIACVDEGAGDPVVLLHGTPTWSFMWRHAIRPLAVGHRVVAPDLVGFGRSDKPRDPAWHTLAAHVRWMSRLLDELDLQRITLVGHDWGGLIGLRLLAAQPARFARVVLTNTGLPDGTQPVAPEFVRWRHFSQNVDLLECGRLVDRGLRTKRLTAAEQRAYDAPYPTAAYETGPLVFPRLVPTAPHVPGARQNRAARETLANVDVPVLLAFSDGDPITAPWRSDLERLFRRAEPPVVLRGPGHFVPEEQGTELADLALAFMERRTAGA